MAAQPRRRRHARAPPRAGHPSAPPWLEIVAVAVAVGAGAALTLDEFALWLNLDDVYWADEGRHSVDVIVAALAIGALVVLGSTLFGLGGHTSTAPVIVVVLVLDLVTVTLSALKGKYYLAAFGIFVPFVALIGAVRAAKPSSWWARRFYAERPATAAKRERRAARWSARRTRSWDAVAGRHGA